MDARNESGIPQNKKGLYVGHDRWVKDQRYVGSHFQCGGSQRYLSQ